MRWPNPPSRIMGEVESSWGFGGDQFITRSTSERVIVTHWEHHPGAREEHIKLSLVLGQSPSLTVNRLFRPRISGDNNLVERSEGDLQSQIRLFNSLPTMSYNSPRTSAIVFNSVKDLGGGFLIRTNTRMNPQFPAASHGDLEYLPICREWRTLAFPMPCLWAALHVHTLDKTGLGLRNINEGLKSSLIRAGGLPLSLSYSAGGSSHAISSSTMTLKPLVAVH
ncbi:hypothetical protein C8R44DRAFT_862986 [Mycena epipterygia]|nr:hypothetical protein C8R44DRAFT_862986 [Mycena epipterygia]